MAVFQREKMIAEWQAMERRLIGEMESALVQCRNESEVRQCRDAYCDLINQERDRICQSYGAQPAVWYSPRRPAAIRAGAEGEGA